jgi:hypothetical protein
MGLAAACVALLVAACGGGSKQTVGEPERAYKVEVLGASFKARQAVARPVAMKVTLRNADTHTIPNLAITVDSFYYNEKYPELAADKRPIWVVEQGPGTPPKSPAQSQAISPPGGGQTTYVNTWALGPLASRKTRTFEWKVVPVKSGTHYTHLKIAAGLGGRATTIQPNGAPPVATFVSHIAPAPPKVHVDPSTGRVAEGAFSATP